MRLKLLIPVATLLSLWTVASASSEVVEHPFLGEPIGPETPPKNPPTLIDPCGLAVDSEANIYVSDYYDRAVKVFGSTGIGTGGIWNIAADSGPCGLALGPDDGLYINVWHRSVLSAGAVIDGNGSTGVATDPANGWVYVDDQTYIAVYEPSGDPVRIGGEPMRIGDGALGRAFGVAVSNFGPTDGYVYVPDASSNTIKVFDPVVSPNLPIQEIEGKETPQGRFVQLEEAAITVEQSSGHVFLAEQLVAHTDSPPAAVYEFDRFGNYRGRLPHSLIGGAPTGIAIDESSRPSNGQIYVTTGDAEEGGVYAFGPAPPSAAIEVTRTGSGGGSVISAPAGIDCGPTCDDEYRIGREIDLSAQPDGHSAFVGWQVDGSPPPACTGSPDCMVELAADTQVSADFERLPQRVLSVLAAGAGTGTVSSQPAGLACGPPCSEEFGEGRVITLRAKASLHSAFAGWSVAGDPSSCSGTDSCQVQMNSDTEVTATFNAIPQSELEVTKTGSRAGRVISVPAGIVCGSICTTSFDQGTAVTLDASADPGSTFAGWSGGGCSGTETCTVVLSASRQVQARFEQRQPQVSVTLSGSGSGAVVGNPPGIACPGTCRQTFPEGTAVLLAAQPAPGSIFAGWSGSCSGRRLCEIETNQDAGIDAEFQLERHTLAVTLAGTGTGIVLDQEAGIHCGLSCSGVYDDATVVILVADAARGSTFTGWQRCPQPSGSRCVIPLHDDLTLGAGFVKRPRLYLGRPMVRGAVAVLEAEASAPGELQVAGEGVRGLTKHVSGRAPVTLRIALDRRSKETLGTGRRLEVRVTLTFRPSDGDEPVVVKRVLTYNTKKGG